MSELQQPIDDAAGLLDSGQTLLEHLNELRIRLTWVVGGIALTTLVCFLFAEQLLDFLLQPYVESVAGAELQTLRPTEPIETFFKVSLLAGAILSMPLTLYQVWLFVAPALTRKEKRSLFIFLPSALLLFVVGISFAWFVLIPAAIAFLSTFLSDVFRPEWTSQEYISFVVTMIFWIGVSFEMPIVIYLIARAGIVTAQALRSQWRLAIVGIAVLAAIITPSIDPITMLLTMLPLVVLYALSILLARLGQRQFEKSVAIAGVEGDQSTAA